MTLRPIEHTVAGAALWFQRQNTSPQSAVSAIKEHFPLDTAQACEALALARGLKAGRASE